ncbi:hypothetical protein D3C80_1815560 [compost metagenome]
MLHLFEKPWVANGRSSDHNAIYTVAVFIFQGLLWCIDISVSEDRDLYAWVIFYFPDQGPVSISLIHLHTGTAMDR